MQDFNNFTYNRTTFKAGLTNQFKKEINECNTQKVSRELKKINIESDFKGNKVIAWCALQCSKLITDINNKCNLKLELPKGIFVEDFNSLNIDNKDALGFINFVPTHLYSNKEVITPEKTIFFNEFKEMNYKGGNKIWEQADEIADINFEIRSATTDFFLETFLHEFAHVIHEGNMLSKIGNSVDFVQTIIMMLKGKNQSFQNLQTEIEKKICRYGTTNLLEMMACDLTKRILDNTSKDNLQPVKKIMASTFYEEHNLLKNLFARKSKLDKLLKNTWNGILN